MCLLGSIAFLIANECSVWFFECDSDAICEYLRPFCRGTFFFRDTMVRVVTSRRKFLSVPLNVCVVVTKWNMEL